MAQDPDPEFQETAEPPCPVCGHLDEDIWCPLCSKDEAVVAADTDFQQILLEVLEGIRCDAGHGSLFHGLCRICQPAAYFMAEIWTQILPRHFAALKERLAELELAGRDTDEFCVELGAIEDFEPDDLDDLPFRLQRLEARVDGVWRIVSRQADRQARMRLRVAVGSAAERTEDGSRGEADGILDEHLNG